MSNSGPKFEAVIGADIGGTNIKVVFVDPHRGNVIDQVGLKTSATSGPDAIVAELGKTLSTMIDTLEDDGIHVGAVGVGCAGVIDLHKKLVLVSPNLPGWEESPLQEKLSQILNLPVRVYNDVDSIGYAEYHLGAGRAMGDFLCVALGTGVGGSLIVKGRAWTGGNVSAGEIGHMTIQPDGERCLCGNRGCLETLASASWSVRRAEERLRQGFSSAFYPSTHQHPGISSARTCNAEHAHLHRACSRASESCPPQSRLPVGGGARAVDTGRQGPLA